MNKKEYQDYLAEVIEEEKYSNYLSMSNFRSTLFNKNKMIEENKSFNDIRSYLAEERMNQDKIYYHVSPEKELKLENKKIWLSTRTHGLFTYNFSAKDSETPTAWKLKANYPLDIFNIYNSSDLEIFYGAVDEKMGRHYIYNEETREEIKKIIEKREIRDHIIMEKISEILCSIGYDGYAEDSFIAPRNTNLVTQPYISKGALCIFDAKKSLHIIEQLDSNLLTDNFLRRKAQKAGQEPPWTIKRK